MKTLPPRFSARRLTIAVLIAGFIASAAGAAPRVAISTERPDAVYRKGETIRFRVEVLEEDGKPLDWGSIHYRFTEDGFRELSAATLGVTGEPFWLEGIMDRPGFLRCEVTWTGPGVEKGPQAMAAAAVSPEEITPSREAPVDFDAFWDEQKTRLSEIPLESQMTRVEAAAAGVEVFDTQISCLDKVPVSGYFARPEGAKEKSLPAVLWVHGAGVRGSLKGQAELGAAHGFLSMDINAHGIPNGQPAEFYKDLEEGILKDYRISGRQNRDGVFFRLMFVRLVRAIDFLTTQPEWNGKVMAVVGHSQGGAQALVAGGLDDRVTFIGAGVPAMCDHTGMLRNRISGWPKLVPVDDNGRADPVVAEVSRYFDAVNFASRCSAEAIVSIGFIDRTCPPTSCYAAFNQLRGPRHLLPEPAMGHAAPDHIKTAFLGALKAHAASRLTDSGEIPAPVSDPAAAASGR